MGNYELTYKGVVGEKVENSMKCREYQGDGMVIRILEPNEENHNADGWAALSFRGMPCRITITNGLQQWNGGWEARIRVTRRDEKYPYALTKPKVGPMSFFDTTQDRLLESIDENEDSIYGQFKRAFLWAEDWVSSHYPEYTILPKSMR